MNAVRKHHPLGPWMELVRIRRPVVDRLCAAGLLLLVAALWITAWRLSPDERGHGTHEQMFGAPCSFPILIGIPCPSCGMTTAFALFVRGRVISSAYTQPAGAFLALFSVAVAGFSLIALLGGMVPQINWFRISPVWLGAGVVVFFGGAWIYKVIAFRLALLTRTV